MPNKFVQGAKAPAADPFNRAPPGVSLTQRPGQWNWEKPPAMVEPSEVVDSMIDNLEQTDARDEMITLLVSGVSIEEIVNVLAVHGVNKGKFTVDVAETIKGPISFYLLGLAEELKLPVKFFAHEEEIKKRKRATTQSEILSRMKRRNPDVYKALTETISPETEVAIERENKAENSFLRESVPEEEEVFDMDDVEEGRGDFLGTNNSEEGIA